jgi:hypothetical protein
MQRRVVADYLWDWPLWFGLPHACARHVVRECTHARMHTRSPALAPVGWPSPIAQPWGPRFSLPAPPPYNDPQAQAFEQCRAGEAGGEARSPAAALMHGLLRARVRPRLLSWNPELPAAAVLLTCEARGLDTRAIASLMSVWAIRPAQPVRSCCRLCCNELPVIQGLVRGGRWLATEE